MKLLHNACENVGEADSGSQAMFYTIEDVKGRLIIIDGGWDADAENLRHTSRNREL